MIRNEGAFVGVPILALFMTWGLAVGPGAQREEEDTLLAKLLEISRVTQFQWSPRGKRTADRLVRAEHTRFHDTQPLQVSPLGLLIARMERDNAV